LQADKKILIALVLALIVALLLIQLWPLELTNPPPTSEPAWNNAGTRQLAERACFDCHSNETVWPWYAHIVPFGNLLETDVHKGRAVLNFSEWDQTCCTRQQIDDMAETVNKGDMPLPYYVILHPEAELTDTERGDLVNGLIATMNEQLNQ
jgi:hypothetical protein